VLIDSKSTFEIMRVLEDVASNAEFAAKEYVGQLQAYLVCTAARADASKAVNGKKEDQSHDEALRKLEEVRLALARNLARALVLDNAM
jgi:nuclear pore complex protein Nup85